MDCLMRIFFDFEFIENGAEHPIIPISIGIVKGNGEGFYAEFDDVDWTKANDWVLANVKPHLTGNTKSKKQIAEEIVEFVGDKPEFWAYFASYDWVILCQLYGKMIDLPIGWPMHCLDIKQEMHRLGLKKEDLDIKGRWYTEHNALSDAQWNLAAYQAIRNHDNECS